MGHRVGDPLPSRSTRTHPSASDRVFLAALLAATTPIGSADSVADITALLAAVPLGKQSRPHWIFSPDAAKALTIERDATSGARMWPDVNPLGGSLVGFPVEVTDQLPAGVGMLVDAAGLAANPGSVEVDTSAQASVEMADPSTQDGIAGTGAPTVTSLWQTNQTGIQAVRFFAFEILRPEAIAAVSGLTWGTAP